MFRKDLIDMLLGNPMTVSQIARLVDESPGRVADTFPTESPSTFQLLDPEGQVHRVPFHRVREVYRDAERIWHRPDPGASETE